MRSLIDIETISALLKEKLSCERFQHSVGVMNTGSVLARIHGVSEYDARIAGLVHDCAKNLNSNQMLNLALKFDILLNGVLKHSTHLLHSFVGAELAKEEFDIHDLDILNAIRFHTTGRENMSDLEKIIFVADLIEPSRNFPGVEKLRNLALSNLDKATLMALDHTIGYVISKGEPLHELTVLARNYLIFQTKVSGVNK